MNKDKNVCESFAAKGAKLSYERDNVHIVEKESRFQRSIFRRRGICSGISPFSCKKFPKPGAPRFFGTAKTFQRKNPLLRTYWSRANFVRGGGFL